MQVHAQPLQFQSRLAEKYDQLAMNGVWTACTRPATRMSYGARTNLARSARIENRFLWKSEHHAAGVQGHPVRVLRPMMLFVTVAVPSSVFLRPHAAPPGTAGMDKTLRATLTVQAHVPEETMANIPGRRGAGGDRR
eukprot:363791-Chlamydomonas_euryale.AAC.9